MIFEPAFKFVVCSGKSGVCKDFWFHELQTSDYKPSSDAEFFEHVFESCQIPFHGDDDFLVGDL